MIVETEDINRLAVEKLRALIDAITAGRVVVQSLTAESQSLAPADGRPAADTGVRVLCVDYQMREQS